MRIDSSHTVLVEGGGSRTWVACADAPANGVVGESTNVVAAGRHVATLRATSLLEDARRRCGHAPPFDRIVMAHAGASSVLGCHKLLTTFGGSTAFGRGALVTNDIVALLLAEGPEAEVAIAIAGTGTGFLAHSHWRSWARASGVEYLLGDEGGGFDLGLRGLRACVRAMDGRGAKTALTASAIEWCGTEPNLLSALMDRVYSPLHKSVIADFARHVLSVASSSADVVAREIVSSSADEVACGIRAVAGRAKCRPQSTRLVLAGSLLTESLYFREMVLSLLGDIVEPQHARLVTQADSPANLARLALLWSGDSARLRQMHRSIPILIEGR